MLNVSRIFLLKYREENDFDLQCVSIKNDELKNFSKSIQEPSKYGMKDYFENIESLANRKKYSITASSSDQSYHIKILNEILLSTDHAKSLSSVDLVVDNKDLNYDIAVYLDQHKNGCKRLYFYKLRKSNILKDDFYIFPHVRRKAGTTKNNKATIKHLTNGISLPMDGCIASFFFWDTENKYEVNVFDAWIFDEMFSIRATQDKYAINTLKRFLPDSDNKITLAQEKVEVHFGNKDDVFENVKSVVLENKKLTKTFADFKNNGNRTIKKIDIEELKSVLDTLKNYASMEGTEFSTINIPTLDKKGKLTVTVDSIPMLAALLENKVIQKLLDGKITIPYYMDKN